MHNAKAKKFLDDHHIEYTDRDIKSENPTAEEIAAWYPQSGKDLKAFFNTSGLIYREQQLKDKLGLRKEEKLALLASNGARKASILVLEDKVLVGFKEKNGWKLSICKKCICDF
ncbi:MAG: arsenate reductase family protein [Veillonella sp.]